MTALRDAPQVEPEVLIEEARRRQRLRRASLTGVAITLLLAAGIFWMTSGGGPPSAAKPTDRGEAGLPTAKWEKLSAAGTYVPGYDFSIVPYNHQLLLFGAVSPPYRSEKVTDLAGTACPRGCGPVVWASTDGGAHWRVDYVDASDWAGSDIFATAAHGVWLEMLTGGDAWRSRNGRTWLRESLPVGMRKLLGATATADDGRFILTQEASWYQGQPFWTSTNGLHWSLLKVPYQWWDATLISTGKQFVLVGADGKRGEIQIWRSTDGVRWARSSLPGAWQNSFTLWSSGRRLLLEVGPGAGNGTPRGKLERPEFWLSSNGGAWKRVATPPVFLVATQIIGIDGGFLADVRNSTTDLWWSRTGAHWQRLAVRNAPPAPSLIQATTTQGNALLAIDTALRGDRIPAGDNTLWRLTLSGQ